MDLDKRKCQDCGYLTAVAEGKHFEVPAEWRETGERPMHLTKTGCHHSPVCHVGAADLPTEYESLPAGEKRVRHLHVITTPRDCDKFIPYQPNLTPEQHSAAAKQVAERSEDTALEREKMDRYEILELKRLNWQAEQTLKQQCWQEAFAEKQDKARRREARVQREWQEAQTAKQRRYDSRWKVYAAVGAVVFALVGFFGGRYFSQPAATNPPAVTEVRDTSR